MKRQEFTPPIPPKFTDAHSVIRAANENYCWIFHKVTLQWWTPGEFSNEFHDADFMSIKMLDFMEDLSIRDPRSGISAAFRQVSKLEAQHKEETQKLIDRIEVFNKKVIEYYQEKSKPVFRKQF